jgi:uncharacterized protein GlcG (DUF336 family)
MYAVPVIGEPEGVTREDFNMTRHRLNLLAAASLIGCAIALPAEAELLTRKDLSLDTAMTIAQTAYEACTKQGYRVSVTVVGRTGEVLLQMRGDNAPPHTMENSFRKAYTSRTFRIPSGEMVKRLKDNPQNSQIYLTNVIAAQGALPITIGEEVIGAVGVSGAPGGDKDEACVKSGLDKVADQLK